MSGDQITFVLTAKDDTGSTLKERFALGQYVVGTDLQFSGQIAVMGSDKFDIAADGGLFDLTAFEIGTNEATGQTAVAIIAGTFELDVTGGGFLTGNFSENLTG